MSPGHPGHPEHPDQVGRVELLLDLGRAQEALGLAGRLLASSPDDPDLHVLLGRALDGLGRHDEALAAAGRALALRPDDADGLLLRAELLVGLDRGVEAEEAARALLRLDPEHPGAHVVLVGSLLLQQRTDEAWEAARRLRTLVPHDADAHHVAGLVAAFVPGEDAAECHRRALALDPQHAEARHELVRAEPGSLREHARTLAGVVGAHPQDTEYRRSIQDWADRTARRALLGAVLAWCVAGLGGVGGLAATVLLLWWWRRLLRDVPDPIRGEARRRLVRTPYLLLTWTVTVVTAVAAVVLTFAPEPRTLAWSLLGWLVVPWLLVPLWGATRWLRVPLWFTPRLVRALFS
ncbi:tetratricopeptide repeat protein [uncultured Nocardioides sp.]|uniref:tetratricopeptide repeat protein n=1 Tax=uncultured Nocardioides sp. TaxID=198441 RepID=UPI00261FF11D|nr:tetratricopeptide repeat protein [uncultured Nocardioides sp.]